VYSKQLSILLLVISKKSYRLTWNPKPTRDYSRLLLQLC